MDKVAANTGKARSWLAIGLVLACLVATPALARGPGGPGGGGGYGSGYGDGRRAEMVERLERRTGGRVLSLDQDTQNGQEVYRARVLTEQGRVRSYNWSGAEAEHD